MVFEKRFSSVQTKSENGSGPELRHHLIPEKHTKIENVKDDQKIKIQRITFVYLGDKTDVISFCNCLS